MAANGVPERAASDPGVDPSSAVLSDLNAWSRALTEVASEGLAIHEEGVIRYVNPALADLLGLRADEVVGRRVLDLVPPRWHEELLRQFAGGAADPYRAEVLRADGRSVPVEVSGRAIVVDGVRYRAARIRDLSASLAAEQALRESERRFRTMVEGSVDGILLVDREGRIGYRTPAADRLLGNPAAEAPADLFAIVDPTDEAALRRAFADALRGGGRTMRVECRAHDGERWFVVSGKNLLDDEAVAAVVVGIRDTTARRNADEALRSAEAYSRTLFDRNPVPVWVWDVESFRFLDANPACEELYGYTREEFLSMTALDIRPPEEVPRLREAMAAAGAEVHNFGLWKHRRKDGRLLDVEVHSSEIDFRGRRARISLAIDVTEKLEAERRLAEAEERYRTLVETIPAVVYLDKLTELSTSLYISPQSLSILGFSPAEFYADPNLWERRIHPDDHDRVVAWAVNQNATLLPYELEYRMIARDGRVVWIHDEGTVVRDDLGTPLYWQGFWVDVTDRHRAEEERREFLARLVAAQEEERYRIAGDVHDDPVQAMTTVALRLAIARARIDDPEIGEEFDKLDASVNRAVDRLRHLLFELHPRTLDVDGLVPAIREYVARLADDLEGTGFRIVDRLSEEPSAERRLILYRIAQEALTNVRKHAGATQVLVTIDQRPDGVYLRVEDDGVGVGDAETEPRRGHLGLAAMRERAELAGGWWRIADREGGGTVVECFVPDDDEASSAT